MLIARTHAQNPVTLTSQATTASPARCSTHPRIRPSSRSSRSRTSVPSPASHGHGDQPLNGHSSSAAARIPSPAAPRGDLVSRRHRARPARELSTGGGAWLPCPPAEPVHGTGGLAAGGGDPRSAGTSDRGGRPVAPWAGGTGGRGSKRSSIAARQYWRDGLPRPHNRGSAPSVRPVEVEVSPRRSTAPG